MSESQNTSSSSIDDTAAVAPENLTELPAVARTIHLPCKKCGVDRFFIVVAHTSPTAAKVKCEVCGSQKTFRLTKAKAEKAAKAPKKAGTGKARTSKRNEPDSATVWADLKGQIGMEKVVPYNMRTKFGLANAIEHPKFGVGFVTGLTNEKIEVMFQEGGRALVHNRP